MKTGTAAIAFAILGRPTAVGVASEVTANSSESAPQVVLAQHRVNPLLSMVFGVCTCAWLLLQSATSAWAATYRVGIGDDCDVGVSCFTPSPLNINAGDSVAFYQYADTLFTGAHNVVADDGSFRCAKGCDGEGGDGTPVSDSICNGAGFCVWNPDRLGFVRVFSVPGIVKYHDQVSGASGVIVVHGAEVFAINAGITGSWYDPAQSGHGLFIEVLPANRFYASWFTFNPAGTQQAWFTGVGSYSGNTATITDVEQPTGGRWIPNFDPTQIVHNPWGTLTFTFSDCDHGRVDFNSISGYGSGSMSLTRLTQPAGTNCP